MIMKFLFMQYVNLINFYNKFMKGEKIYKEKIKKIKMI